MAGEITLLGIAGSVCSQEVTLAGVSRSAGNKTVMLLGTSRAITCAVEPVSVDVHGSPMVSTSDDGQMYWYISINTDPDIMHETGMSVNGYLEFADGTGRDFEGRLELGQEDRRILTTIPYREGIDNPTHASMFCAFDSPNYTPGNVSISYGMRMMSDGLDAGTDGSAEGKYENNNE